MSSSDSRDPRPAPGPVSLLGPRPPGGDGAPVADGTPVTPGGDGAPGSDNEGGLRRAGLGSTHNRHHGLVAPSEDYDLTRAARICSQVCSGVMGDLAPALSLVSIHERRRAECLVAYARTLFDFARQPGMEGERLTEINRWEFSLEMALDGESPGQPIFLQIAAEARRRPWPAATFSVLGRAARSEASGDQRWDDEGCEAWLRGIAAAFVTGLLDCESQREWVAFGVTLMRVRILQDWGHHLRASRLHLLPAELRDAGVGVDPGALASLVVSQCARLGRELRSLEPALGSLPRPYRRAALGLALLSHALVGRIAKTGEALLGAPPRLDRVRRLWALLRARWQGS